MFVSYVVLKHSLSKTGTGFSRGPPYRLHSLIKQHGGFDREERRCKEPKALPAAGSRALSSVQYSL